MHLATRPPIERIQAIDHAVSRRAWPNCRTLARDLEVTRRTILRDIDFMRRLGAPIEFDPLRGGYFYSRPYSLFAVSRSCLIA